MSGGSCAGLHVAVNAHLLSGEAGYRRAGVHRYIHNLLLHLGQDDFGICVTAAAAESTPIPPGISSARSTWPTARAPVRVVWEQAMLPRLVRRIGADVVHGPVYVGPLLSRRPTVITLHDLSFVRHPRLLRSSSQMYLAVLTRLSARRAARVIAVSRHAAQEASKLLQVPPERLDVVHHGVADEFRPLRKEIIDEFRRQRSLPAQYVLYVGTLEPRKNLSRLVQAFAQTSSRDWGLVLAGGAGWGYESIVRDVQARGIADRVLFAGYVPDSDLPLLYNAATVFAYPSLYEGFGMPVIEAMACGLPVLTSKASSLPEVAGDAAELVDPSNVGAIAAGLARLMSEPDLRGELRKRGLARARQFDWRRTARQTAQVYARAAGWDSL